eukprot:TRINITY_DN97887_c0_g1_i1.p1 TRINITY_DN97887_c0_g1~~TRINITY_DN97887_c0_g1_i1.p1  ORF type:complete len:170 (+),score=33.41 TRINITY_DN97887_c0_g1_i1:39-512(+)
MPRSALLPSHLCWPTRSQASGPAALARWCRPGTFQLGTLRNFSSEWVDPLDEDGDVNERSQRFWARRWRRVKQRRAKMHHQVEAAHDQMRAFYHMGSQQLISRGRLSVEEAERFARIDARLFQLQRNPVQLEFYDRRKQFHEEWVQKHFSLRKDEDE